MTGLPALLGTIAGSLRRTQRVLDEHTRASLDAFGETGQPPNGLALTRTRIEVRSRGARLTVSVVFRPTALVDFADALDDDGMPLGGPAARVRRAGLTGAGARGAGLVAAAVDGAAERGAGLGGAVAGPPR
ncbi:hypothetical protein ABZ446_38835 [Streptomyces sp. NPDC005813]|uniref:hypothetical protein n=1 Tax=Streptomyces sp. NPDC005813 TaxID=3155592 RepID=UPI00340B550B